MPPDLVQRIRTPIGRQGLVLALVFAVNLLLVSPQLLPTLAEINPHDEVQYIDSGRSLTEGFTRGFEWSPLSSFVYAPIYLLVQSSADWLVWAAFIGRAVLFTLLWFSFYMLGTRFRSYFHPTTLAGALFVSVTLTEILHNPSDALFASMSALALAWLIGFHQTDRMRDLWVSSAFLGLASLSRNDGLLLLPVFIGAVVYLGYRRKALRGALPAATLPAVALILGYQLATGLSDGILTLGTGHRGYTAFTWSLENNFGLTSKEVSDLLSDAVGDPPSLLGILIRSPQVVWMQVRWNATHLPGAVLDVYQKQLGPALLFVAAVGGVALWRRRAYLLLILMLAWPLHSLVYLAFYLRPGFILLDQFVVLVLAAAGARHLVTDQRSSKQRFLWSLPLIALAIYGMLGNKLAFVPAGLLTLAAMWLAWLWTDWRENAASRPELGLIALFAAGLILRGDYPFPNYPPIGGGSMERANYFLQEVLHRGSRLYIRVPLPAVAARMTPIEWPDIQPELEAGVGFCEVLELHAIRALYIDPVTIEEQPRLWEAVQDSEGECVERALVVDPGSIQIWMRND